MPQRNNFHMLCKTQSNTVAWSFCLQIAMRWWFWVFCFFGFFFFDLFTAFGLLQDKMTLIIFLFGLNLKLEKFHFSLHFILFPVSSPSFPLGSDLVHLHTELLMETIVTQKKQKQKQNKTKTEKRQLE